jgi:DNA-binding IclR family transcriptional regulator
MEELWKLTGETLSLAIRIGTQTVQIEELPSPHDLRIVTGRIFAAPVYAGAAGSEKNLETIIKRIELVKFAPNTITNKKRLMEEVKKIRNYGYAISRGEVRAGASSISAPIINRFCEAALTVYGPGNRFEPREKTVIEAIKRCSNHISGLVANLNELK